MNEEKLNEKLGLTQSAVDKEIEFADSIEKEVYIESSKVNDFLKITDISYCFLVDNFIVGVE